MRNRIACFILFSASVFSGTSQNWAPVGAGITGTDVNTTWSLCAYDSVLFAGGWFNNAGGTEANNIAQWDGINWDSLGNGCAGHINAMAIYNGNLYAGGQFSSIGGVVALNIAKWNGSEWMPVGTGIRGGQYGVCSMVVYNGSLFVGGAFDSAGGVLAYAIAQWNDSTWSALGTSEISAADEDDGVFALAVYEDELYLAGDFVTTGGTNIAKWNGSVISAVGGGTTGSVYSLAIYNGNLYAGGMMTTAGPLPINNIARWNNISWSTIDSGIWGENGYASVNALTVYNNELYAGGFFDTVNSRAMNCIAKWNGVIWSSAGSGINVGGSVDVMGVYNNSLYAGGGFDSAGGVYAKNIAVWTTPASINEISENNKISVYPNPNNGIFTATCHSERSEEFPSVLEIYNIYGEKIYSRFFTFQSQTSINISSQPGGVYLLSIFDGNKTYNVKFVKE